MKNCIERHSHSVGIGAPTTHGEFEGQVYIDRVSGVIYTWTNGGNWIVQTPSASVADEGKVMTVNAQGKAGWENMVKIVTEPPASTDKGLCVILES